MILNNSTLLMLSRTLKLSSITFNSMLNPANPPTFRMISQPSSSGLKSSRNHPALSKHLESTGSSTSTPSRRTSLLKRLTGLQRTTSKPVLTLPMLSHSQ
jgi:hypothetical protein